MDHLLLHCPTVSKLWTIVWSLFGLHWVAPHRALDLLASWQGTFGRRRNISFWRDVLHCIMRSLW